MTNDDATYSDATLSMEIGRAAGRLLMDLRDQYGPIEKADEHRRTELCARGDLESNALILGMLADRRPGDAVLSEESTDTAARLSADRVWIVDPLDGTHEYGQGLAEFAVHIALWDARAGAVIASTVELPAQGVTRCTALEPTARTALPTDRPIRIVMSRSRGPERIEQIRAHLAELLDHPYGVELCKVGSVGAKVEEVLSGRAEGYLHDTGFYEWDVAAPYAVARHHGLIAEHLDGSLVTFNHDKPVVRDLLVCHPALQGSLRAAVEAAGRP